MEWNRLGPKRTKDFIELVKNPHFPGLFEPECLQIYYYPLNFYKNCYLYSLENISCDPPFTLDYLKTQEDILYLDGSVMPFRILNAKDMLVLNKKTVVDYVYVYCLYVIQRPNNVLLLKDVENMPFYGDYYVDFHFDKNNYSEKDIKVHENPDKDSFIVEAPFVFDGKIDPAMARISATGEVEIVRKQP